MRPCIWGGVPSVDAKAYIKFNPTNIELQRGKITLEGYFTNTGDSGAYIKEVYVNKVTVKNANGDLIWTHSEVPIDIAAQNVFVPAGDKVQYRLIWWHDKIPHRGKFTNVRANCTIYADSVRT